MKPNTIFVVWILFHITIICYKSDANSVNTCINEPPQKCGSPEVQPNLLSRLRIVGGTYAVPNSWPWQLSLQVDSYNKWVHNCGASIVSNCLAITAGHCVEDYLDEPQLLRVVAGLHDRTQDNGQTRSVAKIIVHPDYKGSQTQWDSDVALLQLNQSFVFSRNVSAICLPTSTPAGDEYGVATGWGYGHNDGRLNNTLNQVEMPVITNNDCHQYYNQVSSFDHRFCAGNPKTGGKDTCQGDSGGPFVTRPDGDKFYLSGLTSVGVGCAAANEPGIYTDVFKFVNWIKGYLNTNSLPCRPDKVNNCTQSCEIDDVGSVKCACNRGSWLQPDQKSCSLDCGISTDNVKSPWILSLRNFMATSVHKCNAVLINQNWLLTTLRCVTQISIKGNARSISLFSPYADLQNLFVKKMVCDANAGECFLKLSDNVTLVPICLQSNPPQQQQQQQDGSACFFQSFAYDDKAVSGASICPDQRRFLCTDVADGRCSERSADALACVDLDGRHFLAGIVLQVCVDEFYGTRNFDVFRNMDKINRIITSR